MSRFAQRFDQLRQRRAKALIPYVVAGDPSAGITVPLLHALVDAGADALELGVPFSDPMSEGPVIQRAHERALAGGMRLRRAIELVAQFRRDDTHTPVLLMGYANPVEHMGYAQFADAASAAGVDALLTVDIPPEEVAPVKRELDRVGMDNIFLVAPTTPPHRLQRITEQASGFIYYVSVKGVTGAANLDSADVAEHLAVIRGHTALPLCVGFGIRDAVSAQQVAAHADGVVVGSALVSALDRAASEGAADAAIIEAGCSLLREIRRGIDLAAAA